MSIHLVSDHVPPRSRNRSHPGQCPPIYGRFCHALKTCIQHRPQKINGTSSTAQLIGKVFWVVGEPFVPFKQYQKVPCIFLEKTKTGQLQILQFENRIERDPYEYTAWRKLSGQQHDIRVEVLLIDPQSNNLWRMDTHTIITFSSLGRSQTKIQSTWLGKMGLKPNRTSNSTTAEVPALTLNIPCGHCGKTTQFIANK